MAAKSDSKVRAILARPYVRRLLPDEAGGYAAYIHEFPGCVAEGKTADEALFNLDKAAASWLAVTLAHGQPIAEPIQPFDFSGKVVLRIPRGLHRDVAELAQLQGCSINQLLSVAISDYVGRQGLPQLPAESTPKSSANIASK
ncbi:type II toxin-antitoxin system HicB family antitoxin [Duganella sp. BJB488]|uniref:toxin-antitoxin system HicB family antitoxin n=1 Tax=unclassified Duganella TaxID=2636909 RepID=UPI000E344025|nr:MULTISPECIES: toxin-antitoxin system HicB family antitoxin [unclassified Duganella]RFP15354.1 type II toxin-antitoxin system HicB family antitoxin [Duganella sp. BJB489]RFP19910.1 type II toxin-antitoxin system HicB family antitoxin [Duganella sp. BJB488]RFP38298.1 type II toxin-antitoxin system HicB family antitoxin [Duganella sp. BJB480]